MCKKHRNWLVDGLRFFLIAWIVLFHYTIFETDDPSFQLGYSITFDNGGNVGVSMFFFISGFYMGKKMLQSGGGQKLCATMH